MIFALFKAIPLGIFLTIIVCLFIGSAGSSGGYLHIHKFNVDIDQVALDFDLYWSWTLFVVGTGLSWALLFMMAD